jgi:hypothetical protein
MRNQDSAHEDKEVCCHSLSFRLVHIPAESLFNPVFQPVRLHCCWNTWTDIHNNKYWEILQNILVNLKYR